MSEPVTIYTDPDGDLVTVQRDDDAVLLEAPKGALIPASQVPEVAKALVDALYTAAGLPAPEFAARVGSVTMRPGEDWDTVVRRAERHHDTAYPDAVQDATTAEMAAKAAAWAVAMPGGEFS